MQQNMWCYNDRCDRFSASRYEIQSLQKSTTSWENELGIGVDVIINTFFFSLPQVVQPSRWNFQKCEFWNYDFFRVFFNRNIGIWCTYLRRPDWFSTRLVSKIAFPVKIILVHAIFGCRLSCSVHLLFFLQVNHFQVKISWRQWKWHLFKKLFRGTEKRERRANAEIQL